MFLSAETCEQYLDELASDAANKARTAQGAAQIVEALLRHRSQIQLVVHNGVFDLLHL